jgi:hypothetical protein
MTETYHGYHVNIDKIDGNVNIVLNTNGVRIAKTIAEIRDRLGGHSAILVLMHDHLKRKWTEIKPEEIGALTAGTIISDEAKRDPSGTLVEVGRVYWHERYQVEDPIEELLTRGFVRFDGR